MRLSLLHQERRLRAAASRPSSPALGRHWSRRRNRRQRSRRPNTAYSSQPGALRSTTRSDSRGAAQSLRRYSGLTCDRARCREYAVPKEAAAPARAITPTHKGMVLLRNTPIAAAKNQSPIRNQTQDGNMTRASPRLRPACHPGCSSGHPPRARWAPFWCHAGQLRQGESTLPIAPLVAWHSTLQPYSGVLGAQLHGRAWQPMPTLAEIHPRLAPGYRLAPDPHGQKPASTLAVTAGANLAIWSKYSRFIRHGHER